MKIDHCLFPEGLYYDTENFVWLKKDDGTNSNTTFIVTIGITPILATLGGKLIKIKVKKWGEHILPGKSIGSIESIRYFGTVKSPIEGRIVEINDRILDNPKLANDKPYDDGWFVRLQTNSNIDNIPSLKLIENCVEEIKKSIQGLHVRCFSEFPDYEMFEIGIECAATLTKLGELVDKIDLGNVIHLVSDDNSADFEMIRWSDETGNKLLETRREGNLYHFIVKKV